MAAFEIIALDPTTPQLRAPGAGDTYLANRAVAFNIGTLTANTPILDLSATWNNGAVAFQGLKLNVTDTASSGASMLLDLQVAGSSLAFITKGGGVTVRSFYRITDGGSNGASLYRQGTNGLGVWDVTGSAAGSLWLGSDISLNRDAANTLALRNGTAAQRLDVYNTWTDASNKESFAIDWQTTANVCTIGPRANGTGVVRTLAIAVGGTTRLQCTAAGAWTLTGSLVTTSNLLPYQCFVNATRYLGWQDRSMMNSPSDGLIVMTNAAETVLADIRVRTAIQNPVASLTLANNGELGIECTSNTAGNLVYRGSDGTTRRCALVFV